MPSRMSKSLELKAMDLLPKRSYHIATNWHSPGSRKSLRQFTLKWLYKSLGAVLFVKQNTNLHTLAECSGLRLCQGDCTRWVGMDRFLGFVKQIRRSRRRKGKKYRPEEDYHEGYEDVYYYASEHLHRK
ncbi:unnamed protein product [Leuciscus chuanchicus]